MLDTNKVDIVSCKPTTSVYEAKHFRNSHLPFGDEDKHTKTLESVLFPHDLTSSCFELTDMHRQTSWITAYDGRGVFAENVNLLILVRDKNIVWVDVEVECSRWGGCVMLLDYKSIFHTGDPLPETINVNFKWNVEYSYNSDRGFVVVMWCSMILTTLTVLGIIYASGKQYENEIKKQQFKQPIKTTKSD